MSNKGKDTYFLEEVLESPTGLAESAATNAVIMVDAIVKLGTDGANNTDLSRKLMDATIKQIEQIQKLHGLSPDLPFQKSSYQVAEIRDAPLQNEGDIQSQVSAQEAKAQITNALTTQALKEKQGFMAIPLIANTISEWVQSTNKYLNTGHLAQEADKKAKE
jgi:hypothetical protein